LNKSSANVIVGFADFRQAKLLHDTLLYPDSPDAAPILVYFIDRLLLSIPVLNTALPTRPVTPRPQAPLLTAKPIDSLPQLFEEYPAIAKQVVPRLTLLLRDLNDKDPSDTDLSSGNEAIKRVVDGVISVVVDTFQSVDAVSMKRLSERTDMNGEKLGRLIESYVLDETYDLVFFSFSKSYHTRDTELTDKIHSLKSLDVHQVGIPYVDADILSRLTIAIERFRTFGAARTPMEKLEILLETVNVLSGETEPQSSDDEKPVPGALSSDFLVPLLLLVIIRSNVSNLESNLAYVRDFSYGDTERGIVGYTLSSMEAVLYHINEDYARLAELSKRNETFWNAIRGSDIHGLQSVLETTSDMELKGPVSPTRPRSRSLPDLQSTLFESKDREGNSCFMMAIQRNNLEGLQYLVSRPEAPKFLADDENYQHETPLITAMQAENQPFVAILSDTLLRLPEITIRRCLERQGKDGRTVGHYLFNAPELIWKLGKYIPWTSRDKNGQTPLSVLAKTWDHRDYHSMLSAALTACAESTGMNGQDHIDGKGNSLLHVCADEECMKRLLEMETVDPNVVNAKGLTPLLHWSKHASVRIELVKLLFQSPRVDVYARDPRGLTVLHLAAWKGHFEVLREAAKWIDINERAGGTGVTALHVAAREKRMECIEYLVGDWRADLHALEGRGLTAGDMAKDDEVRERLDGISLLFHCSWKNLRCLNENLLMETESLVL
jgi:ankyrin repeat protein